MVQHKIIDLSNNLLLYREDVDKILTHLLGMYPNAYNWFLNKVLPELPGSRKILACTKHNKVVAIAILKLKPEDEKICAFYVKQKYRQRGIGTALMKECLQYLHHNPYIVVKISAVYFFRRLLQKFNFELEYRGNKAYRWKYKSQPSDL